MQILIAAQGVTPNSAEINTNCVLLATTRLLSSSAPPNVAIPYRSETFMKRLFPPSSRLYPSSSLPVVASRGKQTGDPFSPVYMR